jgi:hypothetical protein
MDTMRLALREAESHAGQYQAVLDEVRAEGGCYCHTCESLVVARDAEAHKGHAVRARVTGADVARPTRLLRALDDDKTHAQYLFARKAAAYLIEQLEAQGRRTVVCIGMPSIHEELAARAAQGFRSLLLDLDGRYVCNVKARCEARRARTRPGRH